MEPKVLTEKFYQQNTKRVAKQLLGKYLVINRNDKKNKLMIKETEAYLGQKDKACHASAGKTERTKVMFGPPGRWYVYLIYGMYDMLNIVTEKQGNGCAVLIRAVENYNGPGKLTRELNIDKDFNNQPATKSTGLWIEDRGEKVKESEIESTPRIGVDYAEEWADKHLRFKLK